MNSDEYSELINDIHLYFSRKRPESRQLVLWYEKVKHIPAEAVKYIYEAITDEEERLPMNLPKKIKAGWSAYLRDNPSKLVRHKRTACPDCYGHGLIWYTRYEEIYERLNEAFCVCGNCSNWKCHFDDKEPYNTFTRQHLEELGHKIWPYTDNITVVKGQTLDDMKAQVGIPF